MTTKPHGPDPDREPLDSPPEVPVAPAHAIEIHRLIPPGKNNYHYIATCTCQRWRSEPYRERENAVTKGLGHEVAGDSHLTALAAFHRGNPQPQTTLKWYIEQATDPLNNERDRDMWQALADELADRLKGDESVQAELPLF